MGFLDRCPVRRTYLSLTLSLFSLFFAGDNLPGEQLTVAKGGLRTTKTVAIKNDDVKSIQGKLPRKQKCGPAMTKQTIFFFKIRSGPVQKDKPVIRMALSLSSASLANADEHRMNA